MPLLSFLHRIFFQPAKYITSHLSQAVSIQIGIPVIFRALRRQLQSQSVVGELIQPDTLRDGNGAYQHLHEGFFLGHIVDGNPQGQYLGLAIYGN